MPVAFIYLSPFLQGRKASLVQREVAARRADGGIVRNIPRQVQPLSPYGAAPLAQGSLFVGYPHRGQPNQRLLPLEGAGAVRRLRESALL